MKAVKPGYLAVNQKDVSLYRLARSHPFGQLATISMTTIDVQLADTCTHGDIVALNAHNRCTILENPAEGARCLIADKKHSALLAPKPVFQSMPYPASFTHPAGCNHDMKTLDKVYRLRLFDSFGEADVFCPHRLRQQPAIFKL